MLSGREKGIRRHLVPQHHLAAWLESDLRANHWVSPSARRGEEVQSSCRHLVCGSSLFGVATSCWNLRLNVQLVTPQGTLRGGAERCVQPHCWQCWDIGNDPSLSGMLLNGE